MTAISTSNKTVDSLYNKVDPFSGMQVAGWITSTQTIDGIVHFGPFTSQELAFEWGKQLNNVEVYRIFYPVHNAG